MSKHMQLTVTVRPHYEPDLERTYPHLARHLGRFDPARPLRNPSLYELTGELDQLLYRHEGTRLGEVLLKYHGKLKNLHKSIEKSIADWDLAQADKFLYSMEDVFEEIELELD
ncbi:MAG: hypothetical protein GX433_16435 [Deltaproteobacteria bacterium]|nr:hypothetical protein [Deltaproteobacteria bacterium]